MRVTLDCQKSLRFEDTFLVQHNAMDLPGAYILKEDSYAIPLLS